jgi:hypothetical protein
VRAVEKLATMPVHIGREDAIDRNERGGTVFLSLRGLTELFKECYEKEILPRETERWKEMVD